MPLSNLHKCPPTFMVHGYKTHKRCAVMLIHCDQCVHMFHSVDSKEIEASGKAGNKSANLYCC